MPYYWINDYSIRSNWQVANRFACNDLICFSRKKWYPLRIFRLIEFIASGRWKNCQTERNLNFVDSIDRIERPRRSNLLRFFPSWNFCHEFSSCLYEYCMIYVFSFTYPPVLNVGRVRFGESKGAYCFFLSRNTQVVVKFRGFFRNYYACVVQSINLRM